MKWPRTFTLYTSGPHHLIEPSHRITNHDGAYTESGDRGRRRDRGSVLPARPGEPRMRSRRESTCRAADRKAGPAPAPFAVAESSATRGQEGVDQPGCS